MKTCIKCGIEKPLTEFYAQKRTKDGHVNKCKECTKSDVAAHRNANIDAIREYDRQRSKSQKRIDHVSGVSKSWRKSNPDRYKAHNAVNNALRDGTIAKPKNCQSCGRDGIIHGHHDDYSKPLEVMWLCVPCHAARHKQLKSLKAA